jgi:hypothetical protein
VEELRTTLGIADDHLVAHGYAHLLVAPRRGRHAAARLTSVQTVAIVSRYS